MNTPRNPESPPQNANGKKEHVMSLTEYWDGQPSWVECSWCGVVWLSFFAWLSCRFLPNEYMPNWGIMLALGYMYVFLGIFVVCPWTFWVIHRLVLGNRPQTKD